MLKIASFFGGLYFVLYFIFPESVVSALGINSAHEYISYGFILVGAVAFAVGIINLLQVHGRRILLKHSDWFYSVVLLLSLLVMMTLATVDWIKDLHIAGKIKKIDALVLFTDKVKEAKGDRILLSNATEELCAEIQVFSEGIHIRCEQVKSALRTASLEFDKIITLFSEIKTQYKTMLEKEKEFSLSAHLFKVLNEAFFVSLGSAMFALLGVYIASAAYRAFHIRSGESACMLIAAVIVMLGQIPFGIMISDSLPALRLWLLEVPNGASFRAIRIGAAVAGFILAIRMWLSLEGKRAT